MRSAGAARSGGPHRIERNLVRVFTIGVGVVAACCAGSMATVVVQPAGIALPPFYLGLLIGVLALALALGLVAAFARLPLLRALNGSFVVAYLLTLVGLVPALLFAGSLARSGQLTWVLTVTALPVVSAVLAWGARAGWIVLGTLAGAIPVLRLLVGDTAPNAVVNDLHALGAAALFCVVSISLLGSARRADAAAAAAQQATAERADRLARQAAQLRTHGLVHDEVLATLGFAARATEVMRAPLAEQAERAAELVAALAGPGAVSARDEILPVPRFTEQLTALGETAGARVEMTTRTAPPTLPFEVATALLGAVQQALVNARAHAGQGARIRVRATLARELVRVQVADDGRGFDTARLDPQRMGIAVSILARVRAVPGGSASVRSAPGAGTAVTLQWSAAEARRRPSPGADPASPADGDAPGSVPAAERGRGGGRLAIPSLWRGDRIASGVAAFLIALQLALAAITAARIGTVLPAIPLLPLAAATGALAVRASHRAGTALAATAVALCTVAAGGVLLLPAGSAPIYADAWYLPSAGAVLALLAFRGRPVFALVGVAAPVLVFAAGALALGLQPAQLGSVVVRTIVVVAIAAALVVADAALGQRAARDRARELAALEDEAWSTATRDELRDASTQLAALVGPLLGRIAAAAPGGRALDDAERRECLVLEGRLRDDYRGGRLAREPVRSAADAARRRGVDVVLLDDVPEHHIADELLAGVALWMSGLLHRTPTGTFSGRLLPAGRDALAEAVAEGRPERFPAP